MIMAMHLMKVSSVIFWCGWMPLSNQIGKGEDGKALSRKRFMRTVIYTIWVLHGKGDLT